MRPRPDVSTAGWSRVRTHDLAELCRRLHQRVARRMDATIFFLGLYDATTQTVDVIWQVENGQTRSGGSIPLGTGLISDVVLAGEARLSRHGTAEGPGSNAISATVGSALAESAVAVPLQVHDTVIGLLCAQSYAADAYTERQLRFLQTLADDAAVVVAGLHYSERVGAPARRRGSDLEAVLASMADALLIIDAQGRPVRMNNMARELLSLDDVSIVLGHRLDARPWDQWPLGGRAAAEALRPVVDRLRATEEAQDVEVEVPGAAHRILSFRASPLHDAAGGFTGGVIVFRDVSGRRDVERVQDDMFSIASHDLKTPTTVIKAQSQWLLRRVRQGEHGDVEEGLTMISDQADRLARLLNSLLDLSRCEAGRLDLELAPTDLRGILIGIARAVQSTTETHRIEVSAAPGVIGHWDQRRIEEVVQNLLCNALKYSPTGGPIEMTLSADHRQATVTVSDAGIGIPAAELPRVFERFFRGRSHRRIDGTGLGLYICQVVVAAHGGRVWAESAGPGRGSTFGFSLPLLTPAGDSSGPR